MNHQCSAPHEKPSVLLRAFTEDLKRRLRELRNARAALAKADAA